jgi:hypothetical protein
MIATLRKSSLARITTGKNRIPKDMLMKGNLGNSSRQEKTGKKLRVMIQGAVLMDRVESVVPVLTLLAR